MKLTDSELKATLDSFRERLIAELGVPRELIEPETTMVVKTGGIIIEPPTAVAKEIPNGQGDSTETILENRALWEKGSD